MTRFWSDYYLRYDKSIPKSVGEKEIWGWHQLNNFSRFAIDLQAVLHQYKMNDKEKENSEGANVGVNSASIGRSLLQTKVEEIIEAEVQKRLQQRKEN